MRALSHPPQDQLTLPELLHALSDPVRLDIVRALHETGEVCCGTLTAPVSKSTMSHHLKVLRESGVTHTRVEGTQRFVSIRAEDIERRFPGLLACVVNGVGRAA